VIRVEYVPKIWSRAKRGMAALTAGLILFAQVLAAAHFHRFPSSREYLTKPAVSVDNGLCAVCLLRFHSPSALIASPAPEPPAPAKRVLVRAAGEAPHRAFTSQVFGRAPPASI